MVVKLPNKEMRIWSEKNTICIQVNQFYTYYAHLKKLGDQSDTWDVPSVYGWVKHLKDKVWWNQEIQKSFIELGEIMFTNR